MLVQEARGRGTSTIEAATEDREDFMSAVVTVIYGVYNSVRLL
jgi:hypothetical protein